MRILAFKKIAGFMLAALCIYVIAVLSPYPLYIISGIVVISIGILAGIFGYKELLFLLILSLPFSLETPLGLGDSKIMLPSELILIILTIAFGVRLFFYEDLKKTFTSHPLSLIILFYAGVMVLTTVTSTMPIVSAKFTLINLLYISVYYFLVHLYISRNQEKVHYLYLIYGFAVFLIVISALYYLSLNHFSKDSYNLSVRPFFSDHAIYSACLAMLFPVFIAFVIAGKYFRLSNFLKICCIIILGSISVGILFSYSRAAWVSLATAAVFLIFIIIKIKPVYMMLLIVGAGISFYFSRNSFTDSWKLNKVSSTTQNPTIGDETKSITNISNDISNAERLNRWSCAYRMFLDHPLTGFGPGTYQFQYFSYQRESEMTRISVNTPYNNPLGKGGSAHSEYLLALSESGIFGFLGMAGIMLFSIFYGMRGYYAATLKTDKLLIASAMMAVITYASHTIFNNYLNIDKTASLFWISVSIIATIDSRYKNEDKIKKIA